MLGYLPASNIPSDLGRHGNCFFAANRKEWGAYSPAYLLYLSVELLPLNALGKGSWDSARKFPFCTEVGSADLDTQGQVSWVHILCPLYTLNAGQSPEQSGKTWKLLSDCFGEIQFYQLEIARFSRIIIMNCTEDLVWKKGISRFFWKSKNWFWQETQHEGFEVKKNF